MKDITLFCQNISDKLWMQIHIHLISPLLVESFKCHKVNKILVFGSSWTFQLGTSCSFIFSILLFLRLIQIHWASNFLKGGYSCTTVSFPVSLHNTFSVPLGWHQLQEYVPYIYFLFYHMFSQEFSSLQDYETIKMRKMIGSFRLHQMFFSWLMLSESHAQSGFRQCSNISRLSIIPLTVLSAVTVPGLGEGGHIFLLMQTSKNVGCCRIPFKSHHGRTGSLEKQICFVHWWITVSSISQWTFDPLLLLLWQTEDGSSLVGFF